MTEQEINRLRRKFILASTLSFFLVMLIMGGIIYFFTTWASRNEAMQVLDYIIENDGDMPQMNLAEEGSSEEETESGQTGENQASQESAQSEADAAAQESVQTGTAASAQVGMQESAQDEAGLMIQESAQNETSLTMQESAQTADHTPAGQTAAGETETAGEPLTPTLSPVESSIAEKKYHHSMFRSLSDFFGTGNIFHRNANVDELTHYFAVLYDADGNLEAVKNSFTNSLDVNEAEYYASVAIKQHGNSGSYGGFYYKVAERAGGGTIIVYVDYSGELSTTLRIYYMVVSLLAFGTLTVFLVMRAISLRIVRPEVENSERQKQFITNASHELKTPLAVIRANTEMQEMLGGSNEWTQSTLRQVSRMDGLIRNLVMIARSQENATGVDLIWIDASKPVRETAESFKPVAESESKTLEVQVEDGISLLSEDSLLRQLTSLLTDNAVKYCDDGGTITVSLSRQGRNVHLSTSNSYAEGAGVDCSRFFDRFYREDGAHNTDRGGYGIGLSVAETIVRQMHGKISASWKDGVITFTCQFSGKNK